MAENAIIEFKNNDSVAIIVDFFKKVVDYVLIQQRNQMKEMFEEYCVNKDKEEDVYLTIKQVCERLNVTRQTINTWRKNGMLIPDIHIGRSPKYLESKIKILNNRQS
ncbi:helix-turn-helix domain-containing protein [Elizabethkingia anophelis]|nr:helix-turn-helix domain-containing protein [Elizabethkingia anophelis]